MSDPNVDMNDGAPDGARTLIARAAAADGLARRALASATEDFFLDADGRLDEQTRVALDRLLRALIATVDGEVRGHAVRVLNASGRSDTAQALAAAPSPHARLTQAGVLRDPELMGELIGRVRQELLALAMPAQAPDDPDRPSLINRLVQHEYRLVAQAAMTVLVAESRRRSVLEGGRLAQTDLPAELHHRLVWWVAAALREAAGPGADRALADAAQRSLVAHDEGERLEAAVMRLAVAIDAPSQELAEHLREALGDRRVTLFAGLLAHALGIDYAAARDVTLDPADGRLWVALRALEFDRAAIAQIGVALCEADPRRDVERFADQLDTIMHIDPVQARDAVAPLRLPADFRVAIAALEPRR
jgi:hypothetical protein